MPCSQCRHSHSQVLMDCDLEDVQVNRPFSPVPNLLVHAELNLLHIFLSSLNSLKKALASLYRLLFISSSAGISSLSRPN